MAASGAGNNENMKPNELDVFKKLPLYQTAYLHYVNTHTAVADLWHLGH